MHPHNTRPNKQRHGALKDAYQDCSNEKDVAAQVCIHVSILCYLLMLVTIANFLLIFFCPFMLSSCTIVGRPFGSHCLCFFYSILSLWLWIYPFISRIFSTEYSLVLLTVLSCSLPFISLVTLLMVDIYKPHSFLLSFPMLVYLVLLVPIDPLATPLDFDKSLPYFWVGTSSLNPWILEAAQSGLLHWNPSTSICIFTTGRTFDSIRSMLIPTQAKRNNAAG